MDNGAAGAINSSVKGQPSLETNRLPLRPLSEPKTDPKR
jgi:hypothetical protein